MGEHGGLVCGSIEPERMLCKEIYTRRKDNAPLRRTDEDMAVCAPGKIEPIGIIERAAAYPQDVRKALQVEAERRRAPAAEIESDALAA